ncbi:ribonuclease domain-containing protein [Schlesneria paludicola]|uniref:ribonuclease domain-containing protein n=1 Tax=Schlesneria paludicola TaxID=360056 RepID=UPI00029AE52F|nr:ribonuclease domain-containing protein [Schlesneria paludicola]
MSFQRFSSQRASGFRLSDWLIVILLVSVAGWVWWQSDPSPTEEPNSEIGSINGPVVPPRSVTLPDEDAPSSAEMHPDEESSGRTTTNEKPDEASSDAPGLRQRDRSHGHADAKRNGTEHRANKRELHAREGSLKIANQTIRDLSGRIVFRGTVDLKPTIDRIERGDPHRHRNDGTIFQNRERRIPAKGTGYYKEYVHPTPGETGPGPQRVIIGQEGEIWYTPDHYRTFYRINSGEDER